MAEYRIFVLSSLGKKIEGAHTIVCDSDTEAVTRATEHLEGGRWVEIWQDARVVRRLRPESQHSV